MSQQFNQTYTQQLASTDNKGKATVPGSILLGRVIHVVRGSYLSDGVTPDQYYEGFTSIGAVVYQLINTNQDRTAQSSGNPIARPLTNCLIQYPIPGEIVYLVAGPSRKQNDARNSKDYYYLPAFSVWNSPHHNAMPDLGDVAATTNTADSSYQQSSTSGHTNNVGAPTKDQYVLDPSFIEKSNIKKLYQFTGDLTLEGRWGNSIRFGSSLKADSKLNYWSDSNADGDPITIIRNGQGATSNQQGYVQTVENVNTDASSIYLTAGQNIVVDDIINSFPLNSFGISNNKTSITTAVILTQPPTSNDYLSPALADKISHV